MSRSATTTKKTNEQPKSFVVILQQFWQPHKGAQSILLILEEGERGVTDPWEVPCLPHGVMKVLRKEREKGGRERGREA